MPPKLIAVYTSAGSTQAAIVLGLLQADGIPAALSQESAGAVYGLTLGPLGAVDVLVPESFADQALSLIEAYHRGDLAADAPPDDAPAPE